jgi:hypothetical protein
MSGNGFIIGRISGTAGPGKKPPHRSEALCCARNVECRRIRFAEKHPYEKQCYGPKQGNGEEVHGRAVFCDVFEMQNAKIRRLTSYLMEVEA